MMTKFLPYILIFFLSSPQIISQENNLNDLSEQASLSRSIKNYISYMENSGQEISDEDIILLVSKTSAHKKPKYEPINWTSVINISIFSITFTGSLAGILIKIFGGRTHDENLRKSDFLQDIAKSVTSLNKEITTINNFMISSTHDLQISEKELKKLNDKLNELNDKIDYIEKEFSSKYILLKQKFKEMSNILIQNKYKDD